MIQFNVRGQGNQGGNVKIVRGQGVYCNIRFDDSGIIWVGYIDIDLDDRTSGMWQCFIKGFVSGLLKCCQVGTIQEGMVDICYSKLTINKGDLEICVGDVTIRGDGDDQVVVEVIGLK